jgi:hypothetical protein
MPKPSACARTWRRICRAHIDGETPPAEPEATINDLRAGKLDLGHQRRDVHRGA